MNRCSASRCTYPRSANGAFFIDHFAKLPGELQDKIFDARTGRAVPDNRDAVKQALDWLARKAA